MDIIIIFGRKNSKIIFTKRAFYQNDTRIIRFLITFRYL